MLKEQVGTEKRETLEVIKRELRWPFRDPRRPTKQLIARPLQQEQQVKLFELLTGEDDTTLRPGKELVGKISNPSEHGVRIMFDNGLQGFAHKSKLDDDVVVEDVETREDYRKGKHVRCVVLEVKKEHMSLDVSLRPSDLDRPSTKWPRPENLPPLDEYFDKDTADAVIETMEAESKAQAAHAAALAGAKEGGSSAVVTPLAPGIARRGNVKRACKHPSFRNANYKGVKKELDEMGADAVGLCLIHPSSGAEDQLTLTWCLREGLYKHYVIEEFDKPTDTSIGARLKIKEEEYGDLDEVSTLRD